jgi:acyl-CoA thioesterase-2
VDGDRRPHSLHGHFLAPGTHDRPVRYEVEEVRDGTSFSSRAVRAIQGEREVLRLAASFHVPEPGFEHSTSMPRTPPPDALPLLHDVMAHASSISSDEWRAEWDGLEVRYVPDHLGGRAAPARQQLWVRVRDRLPDDIQLHREVVTYLSDHTILASSLIPHGFMLGDPDLPRATLNHSVWFHGDARADEWLLLDHTSPWAGGALGFAHGAVYTQDGTLVASLAQEGLIRPYGHLRERLRSS